MSGVYVNPSLWNCRNLSGDMYMGGAGGAGGDDFGHGALVAGEVG